MIPILYEKNETLYASNGLGRLRDTIECKVKEQRSGVYECDFTYPVDGAHFDDIICGRTIGVTHDEGDDVQPFDIVGYSKPIDGIVSFHCVHISYRLNGIVVVANNINNLDDALTVLDTNARPSNMFYYRSDFHSNGYMSAADGVPRTVRQLIGGTEGSILDTYGGELYWDRWGVNLYQQRGEKKDFTIRYGLNMVDYNDETDFSNSYNSCIPYWVNGDNVVVGYKIGIGLPQWAGRDICRPMDLSDKFETKPTKTQLGELAKQMLASKDPHLPKQTISVDFIRLQDTGEFDQFENLLSCHLCDSIDVIFPKYGMRGTYKIVETVWNVLEGRYESMELGSLSTTLSEALGITADTSTNMKSTIYASSSATEEVPNASTTELFHMTLDEGKYLLVGTASFPSNATGRRLLVWRRNGTDAADYARSRVTVGAVNGDATRVQSSLIIELTEETEVALRCYQNSSGSQTVTYWYQIMEVV